MINANDKRQLRNLFQSPGWGVVQEVLKDYRTEHFFETSAKRGTDFETMWYVAHKEGGKEHLDGFMGHLEQIADDQGRE